MRVLLLTALLAASPAFAGGTLEGRVVTLWVLTYDDPARPILESQGRTVMVDGGVEFGMGPEYRTPGFDVVPVEIEIGPDRIEFSYGEEAGRGNFWDAAFNGYVLEFRTDCALFTRVAVDREATTMPVTEADIHSERGRLYINVAGRDYGPEVHLALDLEVADCPLS